MSLPVVRLLFGHSRVLLYWYNGFSEGSLAAQLRLAGSSADEDRSVFGVFAAA